MTIREQLEPLIRAAGVTATARRAGVPQPRLSEWLAGRSHLRIDRVEAIAEALGVRLKVQGRRRRS